MENSNFKKITFEQEEGDPKYYITSQSRISVFRDENPQLSLQTSIRLEENLIIAHSTVSDGKKVLSDGWCAKKFMIPSDIATAETISKARAVTFYGVGLSEGEIATAEEIAVVPKSKGQKAMEEVIGKIKG